MASTSPAPTARSTTRSSPPPRTAAATPASSSCPNYISAIAVVYNLPGVDELNLTPATVAGIFHGDITTWNDPAIAADNPDAELPSTAITPVHRSDDSGTTKNFTDYLSKAAGDVWTDEAGRRVAAARVARPRNGTSGVIAAVTGGEGTIGYADESQAGDLGIANVGVGEEFVAPSPGGRRRPSSRAPS